MKSFLFFLKKYIRGSTSIRTTYFLFKRAIFFLLRFTPIKSIADVQFRLPLKELFHLKKLLLFSTVRPYTMNTYFKMDNIYNLVKDVKKRGLQGAFVECGCGNGGIAAIMASMDRDRKTWYLDSFSGIQESVLSVEKIIHILNLPTDNNHVIKGCLKETLPKYKKDIDAIAILRLNEVWYESTKTALEELYDQVVVGGWIVIDDYGGWLGCREAVDEFLEKRKIKTTLHYTEIQTPTVFKKTLSE